MVVSNAVRLKQDQASSGLVDPFFRSVTYLRVSVTDRCDLRCSYCMSENMRFLPKKDLLSVAELDRLCTAFINRGVRKLRLTGGEPLVRKDFMSLVRTLSRHLASGMLDELTLTTNGTQLAGAAAGLAEAGIRRINVSLDTLDPDLFRSTTRGGDLQRVLDGIAAARKAGLLVKINTVALKGINETEIPSLIRWSHALGMDITLIETMPLGDTGEDRTKQYLPLSEVRERLAETFTLHSLSERSGGPARYFSVAETSGRLGFITPLTHNFCENCNRVRLTCTGRLFMCLGQEDSVDLREVLRSTSDEAALDAAIVNAIQVKPRGHDFVIDRMGRKPTLGRHMSMTGG